MSTEGGFFAAAPLAAPREALIPAPHELRVEFLRPPEARTRWRATVTTFGPVVKVPISLFLVFYQLIRIVHAVKNGTFAGGPPMAFELTAVAIYYTVVGLLIKAMWASGKKDGRTLGE